MAEAELQRIWAKTNGHCHFCGDPVELQKRGWCEGDLSGYWEVDHVVARKKGGESSAANYLPACTACNRLRWFRTGNAIRELLVLGLVARDAIDRGGDIGTKLRALRVARDARNRSRRTARRLVSGMPASDLADEARHPERVVKATGAKGGDLLIGVRPINLAMRLRITTDQQPGVGGRIRGGFRLLDAGSGTYSAALGPLVGRDFAEASDLIALLRRREPKVTYLVHTNSLQRAEPA